MFALAGSFACGHAAPEAAPQGGRVAAPPAPSTLDTAVARAARVSSDRVLAARADGALLVGRAELPLPNSDAPPAFAVRWLAPDGATRHFAFEGARLQEAHFVPGTAGVVVLTVRGELSWLAAPDAAPVPLDTGAIGPLSVAAGGRFVAYARGEMPDYEIYRVDVQTRAREPMGRGLAPAWSPALSPDGREALFVSSRAGTPALYRSGVGAAPRRLTEPGPPDVASHLPSGPEAPLWLGEALVYEDDGVVRRLALDGTDRGTVPGLLGLRAVADGPELLARGAGDALAPVAVSAVVRGAL